MRIILFSSGFNGYDISIKNSLQSLRNKVKHYSYRSNCYSGNFHKRFLHKIRSKISSTYEFDRWNRGLIELCEKSCPDIVIILKGEIIYPETIDWIKKNTKSKIICWFMDVISRYSQVNKLVPLYDYFFTYEPDDIDHLKGLNPNVFYLPLAYDPNIFYPMKNVKKKWDLCFIGTWSKNREEFLLSLTALLKKEGFNCIFFMNYYSLFRPSSWIKWLLSDTKYQFFEQHEYFNLEKVNLLFNQSKVCLNIHQKFTKNALSIRSFEIIGSGQLQLIEDFNSAKKLFEDEKSITLYNTANDLVSKLKVLLNNPKCNYTNRNNNTFQSRIEEVLQIIGCEN